MNSYERKIVLVLSALFIALAAVNFYFHARNQVHLKLTENTGAPAAK